MEHADAEDADDDAEPTTSRILSAQDWIGEGIATREGAPRPTRGETTDEDDDDTVHTDTEHADHADAENADDERDNHVDAAHADVGALQTKTVACTR